MKSRLTRCLVIIQLSVSTLVILKNHDIARRYLHDNILNTSHKSLSNEIVLYTHYISYIIIIKSHA